MGLRRWEEIMNGLGGMSVGVEGVSGDFRFLEERNHIIFFLPSSPMYLTMPFFSGSPSTSLLPWNRELHSSLTLIPAPGPMQPHDSTLHASKTQGSHCFPAARSSSICCTFWSGGKGQSKAGLPDDGDWRMRLSAAIIPKDKAVAVTPTSGGKGHRQRTATEFNC